MFELTRGIPAAAPAFGLVAAAESLAVDRWEAGLAWVQERCGTAHQLVPWCSAPDPGYDPPGPAAAYYQPVTVRWAEQCTTLSGRPDLDRIRRQVEAQSPFVIARELWTGAGSIADPHKVDGVSATNAALASADATTIGGSPATNVLHGLGRLEQAALEASHGQPVFLHLPILMLPHIADRLFRVGNTLYTMAGSTVVADAGYPGTGPAAQAVGATAWAYATSPVAVLTTPVEFEDSDPTVVDHATNTRTVWAARTFAALFDPCVHLATEITL